MLTPARRRCLEVAFDGDLKVANYTTSEFHDSLAGMKTGLHASAFLWAKDRGLIAADRPLPSVQDPGGFVIRRYDLTNKGRATLLADRQERQP